jgi:hypothetical protein
MQASKVDRGLHVTYLFVPRQSCSYGEAVKKGDIRGNIKVGAKLKSRKFMHNDAQRRKERRTQGCLEKN